VSIFPSSSMSDETEYDWEELSEKGPLLGPPTEITETVHNTMRKQCIVTTKCMFFTSNIIKSIHYHFQIIPDLGTF